MLHLLILQGSQQKDVSTSTDDVGTSAGAKSQNHLNQSTVYMCTGNLVQSRPWICTKRSCDIVFMKMKVNYDFAFEKRLVHHILNKKIAICFFKPASFS